MTGQFISFEGGEGSGKTTQIARLAATLEGRGQTVIVTREPGGTQGAEAIRALLVRGAADRWDGMTELLLLMAARRDHVQRVIRPALAAGRTVLCDRFIDSTRVYQGVLRGLGDDRVCMLHDLATDALWPDRSLLLDVPVEVGLARAGSRKDGEDRFEKEGFVFHTRLREAFLMLAQKDAQRICIVDAARTVEDVADAIAEVIRA
jgi:dTMP kinase